MFILQQVLYEWFGGLTLNQESDVILNNGLNENFYISKHFIIYFYSRYATDLRTKNNIKQQILDRYEVLDATLILIIISNWTKTRQTTLTYRLATDLDKTTKLW